MRLHFLAAALAMLVVLAPASASAEDPSGADPAANERIAIAESLFAAARSLSEAGRYEEAAAKFEESNKQAASASALLNLGLCFEKLGRTASAWAAYKAAVRVAKQKEEPAKVAKGEELLRAIEPTLSKLTLQPVGNEPGLEVWRGETVLGTGSFGTPIAVDPGEFVLRASAPGKQLFSKKVVLAPGEALTIELPALEDEVPLVVPPPPVAPTAVEGPSAFLVAGAVMAGVGVSAVAVGATLGGLVLSDRDGLLEDPALCPNQRCTDEGYARLTDLRATATASTAAVVGGALLAAGGGALLLVALFEDSSVVVAPQVGPTAFGLSVAGAF